MLRQVATSARGNLVLASLAVRAVLVRMRCFHAAATSGSRFSESMPGWWVSRLAVSTPTGSGPYFGLLREFCDRVIQGEGVRACGFSEQHLL